MITRVYADNFRCLVNFELPLERLLLLMGKNGSGKSSVFDVLEKLQALLRGGLVADVFAPEDLTEWMKSPLQTFELAVQGNGGQYEYRLVIEHARERGLQRIKEERLRYDGRELFAFRLVDAQESSAQLYRDDYSAGPAVPFDWRRSGVGALLPRRDNTKLTWFKEYLTRLMVVRINPFQIAAETCAEAAQPRTDMTDFVSWYRYVVQGQQRAMLDLTAVLRDVLPRFDSFELQQEGGRTRVLYALFAGPNEGHTYHAVRFDKLSHGQQALVVLYSVLMCAPHDTCLCLDEPDNFVMLAEIQPFVLALRDRCQERELQTLVISHHPEYINYFGPERGLLFQRTHNGPVRARRVAHEQNAPLDLAEVMARGWEDGDA